MDFKRTNIFFNKLYNKKLDYDWFEDRNNSI
jgi:hypothetical protein